MKDKYTRLPDGESMLTKELLEFKEKYPETYRLLITQGLSAVGI